ncbi:MAG: DegT/DnrJ/EryC1/StrS family aminotransferase [Fimbriimonadaceae bacterium]|nr:DegT/DnrJ/EryC1/StrS family aminotransferase [Fimbriimonadaceae bacterium]
MNRSVPFLDLEATYRELEAELDAAYMRVMRSGRYLLGEELEAFESEYAAYCGAPFCIGVASGLDALTLSLRALDVGPGDEVIVPSNTYIATWLAISSVGAQIVPVEPNGSTYNIDPAACEAAVTHRTKVILPVHLYGQPADMAPLAEIAARHDLKILSDGAQAHGSKYQGQPVGAFGDVTAWSFYPSKNLGAFADAGAVTTHDAEIAEQLRLLRNYGSATKYYNEVRGVNSRMDELQAAFLRVKLGRLDEWNNRRAVTAESYHAGLQAADLVLPSVSPDCESAWHLFVIRHPERDQLGLELERAGVATSIHYPVPPFRQKAYAGLQQLGSFPVADLIHRECLSLPIGPHLATSDSDYVIQEVIRCTATVG